MHECLDGLRVLDFSHALAGPYCTLLLSYYGATVYKVEPPEGEIGRGWGPPFTGGEASYFLALNAGKQGMSIDMKKPEGAELCGRLAGKVDVLIENFRPGTMARFGLGYEQLHARNPRLIYCSISGYGQNGPSRDEPAMDLILQASSGLMSFTGTADGELVRCGHSVADITAGMFAMIGILLALQTRNKTGWGQYIDVSMLDSMISAMSSPFANFHGLGRSPRPLGSAFASIVPYSAFPASDREIVIAIGSERLWIAFCSAIEQPGLAADPAYRTNADRIRNRTILEPLLAEITRVKPAAEWIEILGARGVPCSTIKTFQEVADDPQTAIREMIQPVDHGSAGVFPVTGVPVKLSGTPGKVRGGAPGLGQDNEAALKEILDISEEEWQHLRDGGVI